MTPFPPKEEIEEKQRLAKEAHRKILASEFSSELERQQLVRESWPFGWQPKGNWRVGRLEVWWDKESGAFMIHDGGGFITSIITEQTLAQVIREEAEHPGLFRGRLTRVEGQYPAANEVKHMIEEAELQRQIKRFSHSGQRLIDFNDLELDI